MDTEITKPWWKHGYVWLIIGGPLLVIIASFITVYLAVTHPDEAIEDYYRKGIEINRTIEAEEAAMAPALKARNHAQTGLAPQQP